MSESEIMKEIFSARPRHNDWVTHVRLSYDGKNEKFIAVAITHAFQEPIIETGKVGKEALLNLKLAVDIYLDRPEEKEAKWTIIRVTRVGHVYFWTAHEEPNAWSRSPLDAFIYINSGLPKQLPRLVTGDHFENEDEFYWYRIGSEVPTHTKRNQMEYYHNEPFWLV